RGAQAIHPGYGFLAENADFAQAVVDNGLVFIGPPAAAIQRMGDKNAARETMKQVGVPTTPGSDGPVQTAKEAASYAEAVGYPVLIKASAGGGGRGMREVWEPAALADSLAAAKAEALAAFGNDQVYLEKLVQKPRHIEIQVLADNLGNAIHLGERDCSIQRRHQKLLEESPSPAVDHDLRMRIGEAALAAVRAVGYRNAGTVEFLLAADNSFYFMEMNTRIQVEHPITEWVTNTDLVKEQLRIAAGEPISCLDRFGQEPVGHAIEFRINAEDSEQGFLPSPGRVTAIRWPGGPGVRLDTHLYAGYTVPPTYDSLIAKLVVWGRDRQEAIQRGRRALAEFQVDGIKTTIPFHRWVLDQNDFVAGDAHTDFCKIHGLE
ncbi:MAG: ATP-grasp domain-containing protein, partial [Actinomycetia bacterium]|nr:ATP-grasp domain-containing protein [Actinomycetes bacterium]